MSGRAGQILLGLVSRRCGGNKVIEEPHVNCFGWAHDVEVCGSKPNPLGQGWHHGHFAIFHTRRDLRKDHVARCKSRKARFYFSTGPPFARVNAPGFGLNSRHWHEWHPVTIAKLTFIHARVQRDHLAQRHDTPRFRDISHHATNAPCNSSNMVSKPEPNTFRARRIPPRSARLGASWKSRGPISAFAAI